MTSLRKQKVSLDHGHKRTAYELSNYGISQAANVYWNLNTPELYEEIARRQEGVFSKYGSLLVDTGEHTGRSAKDKFIVREPASEGRVWWAKSKRISHRINSMLSGSG